MIENKFIIKAGEVAAGTEFVEIPFEEWNAKVGDEGYYLIADVHKCGSHMCHFTEKEDQEHIIQQSLMPIFGVKNKDGYEFTVTTLKFECNATGAITIKNNTTYAKRVLEIEIQ